MRYLGRQDVYGSYPDTMGTKTESAFCALVPPSFCGINDLVRVVEYR
jgi:hypothetical protein